MAYGKLHVFDSLLILLKELLKKKIEKKNLQLPILKSYQTCKELKSRDFCSFNLMESIHRSQIYDGAK